MNRLKELRKMKGLSLKEVAKEVGLAESQLSFYENGKRKPRDEKVWIELARFYNVSVGYLLGNTDIQVPRVTDGTKVLWRNLEKSALENDSIPEEEMEYISSLMALETSFETSLEILHSIAIDDDSADSFANSIRNYTHTFQSLLQMFGPDVASELSNSFEVLLDIIQLRKKNLILKDKYKKSPEEIFDEYLDGKRKITESLDKLFLKDFNYFRDENKQKLPPSYISKLKKENE